MINVLRAWNLQSLPYRRYAERENVVYAVGSPPRFALRAHRPGLRTPGQVEAELTWMASLADNGLPVPRPLETAKGELVLEKGGRLFSLITWLPGRPLGKEQAPLDLPDPVQTFEALGQLFGRIHALATPCDLDRPDWTLEGLVGETPVWGAFWDHCHLSPSDRDLLLRFRKDARAKIQDLNLPWQLIHADPLQENILVDGSSIWLIDFDDCAYGYPLFDLATLLVQRLPDPRFADLRDAVIEGYGGCDREALALIFTLRCLTYVGWIRDKMNTPEGKAMSGRIVARAVAQTHAYLEGKSPIWNQS